MLSVMFRFQRSSIIKKSGCEVLEEKKTFNYILIKKKFYTL